MARKKSAENTAAINFRCSAEMKSRLEILAFLSGKNLSEMLVEMCESFIKANERRIKNIERSKAERPIIKATFATSPTATNTGGASDKGGDEQ